MAKQHYISIKEEDVKYGGYTRSLRLAYIYNAWFGVFKDRNFGWNITHLPTGGRITHTRTLTKARELCQELSDLAVWAIFDEDVIRNEYLNREETRAIIRKYRR